MGLFGGKTDSNPDTATRPAAPKQPVAPSRVSSEAAPTVIGGDTLIKGEISSRTDMLVEGRVEGRIHGEKRVIIGENGNVEAKVEAEIVIVRGTVKGDCEGTTKVEIASTGKVFGNISAKAIVVAEGATFRGSSKMSRGKDDPPTAKPATSGSPAAPTQPGGTRPASLPGPN